MRRYAMVSGVFFTVLCGLQLLRLAMRWPINVAGAEVPLWASGVAALILGTLAVWAFRARGEQSSRSAG